ncbi:NST UDP-N-acetylglucosamine transporter [Colletotrichum higginsianum]|nr:NST UDP-N-acetylglucosamine transporter [Colletotrichum higginsianum]
MTSSAPTRRRGQPKGISSLSSEKMEPAPRGDDDEKNITDNANGSAMNGHPSTEKPMQIAGRIVTSLFAQWIAVGVMLGLIFGGCCSNVYALEAIIKSVRIVPHLVVICSPNFTSLESNPRAFLFVAITGYFSQFDGSRPPFFIRENKVPLRRWIINIVLFFSINVLNNHAFSYDISVPVHIILRSGGSITTMIAGTLYGKKYSRIQIVAVVLLTFGVITAAWSDAQSKASHNTRFNQEAALTFQTNKTGLIKISREKR